MKTIVEGNIDLIRILGRQKQKSTLYRKMKYLIGTECCDGFLLHNVITGRMILLSDQEKERLLDLPIEADNSITSLIEDYFLVPVDFDETELTNSLRALMKHLSVYKGVYRYVIFTTTNCNARCYYCYESELPHINLRESTANQIIDYLIRHKKNNKQLYLSWFGGEPLLGHRWISYICDELRKAEIEIQSAMTSNGYLFTQELMDTAIKTWNLRSVQITLDGTENVYNQIKAYSNVSGSPYKRVLDNITMLLANGIRVTVRLNLDQHNLEDIQKLIEELSNRFSEFDNLNVYVKVVFDEYGFSPLYRDKEMEEKLYQYQLELTRLIDALGLSKQIHRLPELKISSCVADDDGGLVIFPDGKLYKCETIEEYDQIGDIYSGISNKEKVIEFKEPLIWNECTNCPLMPSCLFLKKCPVCNRYKFLSCEYDIERVKKEMLRQYKHQHV